MSHPSRGLPPRDLTLGYPAAANALGAARDRVAARALEIAVAGDPTFADRYGEVELRAFLADLMAIVRPLGVAVASRDPMVLARWAELAVPRYRKRSVPMDDLVQLFEGLRRASTSAVDGAAMEQVDAAIDEAAKVFRWHRRLGGDARKRNRLLAFLYKGA